MVDYAGKVVLITGATSGIGRETALHLGAQGAFVAVAGRRYEEGEEVARQIDERGGRGLALRMDVSVPGDVERGVAETVKGFGAIDLLVGNAAIEQQVVPIDEMSVDDMDQIIAIDFKGMWHLAHFGLPHLRKAGGAIVFISSFWSRQGGPGLSAYTAAKGAINAMTRQLAVEQGPNGVRVNCLVVGSVQTPQLERFTKGADTTAFMSKNVPLGRIGQPLEIARAIEWIGSDDASYVTGQCLGVDGGMAVKMTYEQ